MLLTILLNCDGLWAWPWPILLAFLLGAILGWLLHKILGDSENEDLDYKQKYLDTKAELSLAKQNIKPSLAGGSALGIKSNSNKNIDYQQKYLKAKAELDTCKENNNTSAFIVDDSVKDDLTKIEGIGPKIQELLNADGIWSWKQLASVNVERIQNILDNAGPRYRVHNPASWPLQAKMCFNGEWDKLDKWQDEHKGGRL
jgi:predicted flap endonuclease-1-like 5' DNA nuclease